MNTLQPWTISDYLSALWRYKGRFVFILMLAIGAGAAFIIYMPKSYESEAKLFVRVGPRKRDARSNGSQGRADRAQYQLLARARDEHDCRTLTQPGDFGKGF